MGGKSRKGIVSKGNRRNRIRISKKEKQTFWEKVRRAKSQGELLGIAVDFAELR